MNQRITIEWSGSCLVLFASSGTLICCALPILLVSTGLGAVVAQTTFQFPFLVTLSEHAIWMFGGSALLLALGGWLVFLRPYHCPADPVLRNICENARKWNHRIWWLSLTLWCIGFGARYLLPIVT